VQSDLDELHSTAIAVVGRKLISLKIQIPEELKDHLINTGVIES
jgi:hypothetical protein